jgi:hypothetical protein
MPATTIARSPRTKKMTAEEYFAFEEKADVRHEFEKGKLALIPETTHFQPYFLVESEKIILEQHLKNKKGQWVSHVFREPSDKIFIEELEIKYPTLNNR